MQEHLQQAKKPEGKKIMHCPYCGGLNQERATFCVSCGRDLTRPPKQQAAYTPARPGVAPQGRPINAPPIYRAPNPPAPQGYAPAPPRPASQPVQPQQAPTGRRQQVSAGTVQAPAPIVPPSPAPEPEPPAPFPPKTLEQFQQLLEPGAQQYTVVESRVGDGRRKLVRIAYPHCAGWQQAATLLKALKEQQDAQCNAIIIQGVLPQQQDVYAFTNGQLQFERNVRLGGQVGNRYVVETENGFASNATRFVLNE
jgi:hypothetical protein